MKEYELAVLFHPDLEMNLDPALDKIKKLIEANGGKIIKEEADGKKRLAYPIKGQDFAIYYFFNITLPTEAPEKLSSTMNITDEVIRYMLVRADARREKAAEEAAKRAKEAEQTDDIKEIKETNEEKGE